MLEVWMFYAQSLSVFCNFWMWPLILPVGGSPGIGEVVYMFFSSLGGATTLRPPSAHRPPEPTCDAGHVTRRLTGSRRQENLIERGFDILPLEAMRWDSNIDWAVRMGSVEEGEVDLGPMKNHETTFFRLGTKRGGNIDFDSILRLWGLDVLPFG